MASMNRNRGFSRRDLFRFLVGGLALPGLAPLVPPARLLARSPRPLSISSGATLNDLFWVQGIPDFPFSDPAHPNDHLGLESLLYLMADNGLKFYRSSRPEQLCGPSGLIARDDVVLIKVNAQWKYRGATNSDLVRGLIQRLLDHPDGFTGEAVIVENGQGRGSLACDTSSAYGGDTGVHANANDESHSFLYLVNSIFRDPRVSAFLLDPVRATFIGAGRPRHQRLPQATRTSPTRASPPPGGRRVELRDGIWNGTAYDPGLKLINVPVLKHHDTGGSEIHGQPEALLRPRLHGRRTERPPPLQQPRGDRRQDGRLGRDARPEHHRRDLGLPHLARRLARRRDLPRQPDSSPARTLSPWTPGRPGTSSIPSTAMSVITPTFPA